MASFGTDETIGQVVRQYSPMLLRLAAARLPSTADAEDAVQEAFIRLLDRRPEFQDAEHEKAWLIRVTLQRAADIRRRKAHETPLDAVTEACGPEREPEREGELLSAVRAPLTMSASAIALHLSASQVAERMDQHTLAQAFEDNNAVTVNETAESGGYAITLMGLTSGANLDEWNADVDVTHTYAVVAVDRLADPAAAEALVAPYL